MKLNNLKPAEGSTHARRRIGRGPGSGLGGTSTRGHKGAKARSGYKKKVGFEGGQMPLARRVPKRGFHNIFAKPLEAVNVSALEIFEDNATVGAEELLEAGVISKCVNGVKILGNGTISKKLTVKANAFSESAKQKIEEAGGKAEVI